MITLEKEELAAACVLLSLPLLTMACVWACDLIYRRSCRREEYRRVLKERALDRYWRRHCERRAALKEKGGAE